ncbi:CBD9-like protein [Coprinopsis marcescibilis]|uniref:CBD9-like protein n=1 Tax=Coprinopsis marcescibilis TaxID=230819 RepID=A0A5C3L6W3_COPMA|nr:CBD9-like protein [Coprinopsis marcescibilis]
MLSAATFFLGLFAAVKAQTSVGEWADPVAGVTWTRWTDPDLDVTTGWVFPPLSGGQAPDEFVGIFQAPSSGGYIGSSLGGGMRENLLLLAWTDGKIPRISPRWATDYAPPGPYAGPRITILGSSGNNDEHQRIVFRCQNCTTWVGGTNGIPAEGYGVFGFAYNSFAPPLDPSDINSDVYRHSHIDMFGVDVGAARNPEYSAILNTLTNAPLFGSPAPEPTTTSSAPKPTQSVYGQCGGRNYNGPIDCATGTTCKRANEWFWQCVPN